VLVRVEVGDAEAGVLQALDLGVGFGDDFRCSNAEGEEVGDEAGEEGRKDWPLGQSVGICSGGRAGVPSTRRMWQPTSSCGLAWARATASSKKAPVAISVAEESAWAR